MTEKQPYTFTVLRYVHDLVTSEFVNVGVLLHASKSGAGYGKFRTSMGRVKSAFPSLNRADFVSAMKAVQRGLREHTKASKGGLLRGSSDASALARMIVPLDDSSLQWSSMGGGLSDDLKETVDVLFERLVIRNDLFQEHRSRSDEDVWRPVRELLVQRNVPVHLEEKMVVGASDHIVLKHAWKNGDWHAYEPISFDLVDADGIKEKARRWLGHLEAVHDGASEKIRLNLLLGAPSNEDLIPAYQNAQKILSKAAFNPTIYPEDAFGHLVDEIEDEVRHHQRRSLPQANQGIKPR